MTELIAERAVVAYRAATDLRSLLAACKQFDAAPQVASESAPIRLAITGNYSTQFLARGFSLALAARGLRAEVFESGYNRWQLDMLDGQSELFRFAPTHILVALTSIDLAYGALRSPTQVARAISEAAASALTRSEARVLVTLPEPLADERSDQSAAFAWRRETRAELAALATDPRVTLVDLDPLIQVVGHAKWFDDRYYDTSKIPFHPDQTPRLLARLADAVAGTVTSRCKIVIVDLDDTLWGGRVGDDGWQGVELDPAEAGRHHLRLQMFLRGLKDQGVLLAIASKNESKPVLEVFERRAEMILRFEDFVESEIHWEPKSVSVTRILRSLNLTDAGVVFLDDNPAEREEVRRVHPGVWVPELPANPAEWVPHLLDSGVFDRRVVTRESATRQQLYLDNARRDAERERAPDIDKFLSDLDMELVVYEVVEHRDRVVELIQKTNQFNLTTRRHGWNEIRDMATRAPAMCYRLTDRFGDNGIISVVLLDEDAPAEYRIDLWLMSCRVMGRMVEHAIMDDLLRRLAALGARRLVGEYIPTAKNVPVRGLFERLGFQPVAGPAKSQWYQYAVDGRPFAAATPHVRVVDRVPHPSL